MFDAYKSYDEGLILMGVFIALSGLMLYPIPCIRQALDKVRFNQTNGSRNITINLMQNQAKDLEKSDTEQSIIKNGAAVNNKLIDRDDEEALPIL